MSLREKLQWTVIVLLLIAVATVLVQLNAYHSSSVSNRNGQTEVLCDVDQKVSTPTHPVIVQCRRAK